MKPSQSAGNQLCWLFSAPDDDRRLAKCPPKGDRVVYRDAKYQQARLGRPSGILPDAFTLEEYVAATFEPSYEFPLAFIVLCGWKAGRARVERRDVRPRIRVVVFENGVHLGVALADPQTELALWRIRQKGGSLVRFPRESGELFLSHVATVLVKAYIREG